MMARCWVFVLLALIAVQESSSHVMTLTTDTFDTAISSNPIILVEFYAPWCGHCQRLAPEYEQAAKELSSHDPPLPLAKVDATEEKDLAMRYDVQSYPTMKVFHDEIPYDYDGPRHASGIVEYMEEQASPQWRPPPDEVLVLTADNFTQVVNNADIILVEFYAPWCGHCKRLAPEYQKAAEDLKSHGIPLAKVDATVETDLASRFSITGYPALKLFRKGKEEYEYDGRRKRYDIVDYMREQAEPASIQLHNKMELEQFRYEYPDPVVIAFPSSESDQLLADFNNMANVGRGGPLEFAYSFSAELARTYNVEVGAVAIFRPELLQSKYEPAVSTFKGSLGGNASKALQRVLEEARPLVGLRDKGNEKWYNNYPLLAVYLEMDRTREGKEEIQYWRNRLVGVAAAFRGRVTVVMSDEEEYGREVEVLGMAEWGEDVAVGLWASDRARYTFTGEVGEDDLTEFLEAYYSGDLKPHIHSQPKSRRNDGPVTIIVGSTFQEIVFNPKTDVLVEFYAPWSEPCKSLEPKYKELAKKYKKNKKLVIAKFDATANDSPLEFDFSDFPAIFFVAAGEGAKVVKYEGEKEVKHMVKFLERKATYALGKKEKKERHKKEEL